MRGLGVMLVAVVVATVAEDPHKKELREHYEHLAYIAGFSCHHPQPRVVSVEDLFTDEARVHKAYFPDITVLHRCDNYVGCCPSNHICRPKHVVTLELPFKITFLEDVEKHKKGSWIMEYHNFANHTECECIDSSVCEPAPEENQVVPEPHYQTTESIWTSR